MKSASATDSQRLHQLLATVRRVVLASVVLDVESVRLVRYDLGLVIPPLYLLQDKYMLSQVAHSYQNCTGSEYNAFAVVEFALKSNLQVFKDCHNLLQWEMQFNQLWLLECTIFDGLVMDINPVNRVVYLIVVSVLL